MLCGVLLFPIYPNFDANVKRCGPRARAAGQGTTASGQGTTASGQGTRARAGHEGGSCPRAQGCRARAGHEGNGCTRAGAALELQGRAAGQGGRAAGQGLQGTSYRASCSGQGLQGTRARAAGHEGAKKHTSPLSWCVDVSVNANHSRKTRHQHSLRLSRCRQHHHERRCIMSATVRRAIKTHRRQPKATMPKSILKNSFTNQLLAIV